MQKMRCVRSLGLVVLAACNFPRLPELSGGGDGAPDDGAPPPVALELLAGDIRGSGNVDGAGASARFRFPSGIAIDSVRNLYLADTSNHTIRKITASGVVTTLAGVASSAGYADGAGTAARFSRPSSIAIDSNGNLYVAEELNNTIRKITPSGNVTTLAGTAGASGSTDGTGAAARFDFPTGLAIDLAGNLYVADSRNHTIRKVTPTGDVITLAGTAGAFGRADGMGAAARFGFPSGLAIDRDGNVYVADRSNACIRKITPDGVVTTLAGGNSGTADGTGTAAQFVAPFGVAVDSTGVVYVADESAHNIRRVAAGAVVTTLAGAARTRGTTDGTGTSAHFNRPGGMAVDSAGNVYIADRSNSSIRKITGGGVVTTLAGTARPFGTADGTGTAARFDNPSSVAASTTGDLYVADSSNHTIRKVTSDGVVTTLAGSGGMSGRNDGRGAAAGFNFPSGLVVDSSGHVYVGDQGNIMIRKVDPEGVVTTLAGNPFEPGSVDGPVATARFESPAGMAIDRDGNVYVADVLNHTIRKITASGIVTTLAGTALMSGSADGTGAAARFSSPNDVAVDAAGTLYVTDQGSHVIRKVTAEGVVTTLAGAAGIEGSADGTGADARFRSPNAVAVDGAGNVYVADSSNSAIRKITPEGVVTTIAGSYGAGRIVLGTTPGFAFPVGLAISGDSIVINDNNALLVLRHGAR